MISGKEIHVLDRNAEFYGVPAIKLMENAGKGVAEFVIKELKPKTKNVLILCGLGNNGGDGLVASRFLSQKFKVTVFIVGKAGEIRTQISKTNYQKLKKTKAQVHTIQNIDELDNLLLQNQIIIDSMLGIGLSGKLREPYYSIVKKINNTKNKTKISVDTPTGLGTNMAVKPDYTITFHDAKNGMNKQNSGKIKIVNIGIPKKAEEYVGPGEITAFYPKPKKQSHKGDNGRLLVVGGGPYYGAPALSSFAAQRTGADLIYVATPKKVARAITSYSPLLIKPIRLARDIAKISPTLIVKELHDKNKLVIKDVKLIEGLIKKTDALLIGPGLGNDDETNKAIEKIIPLFIKHQKPIVIDADAIKIVGKKPEIIKNSNTVLTPHAGEFKELTGVKLPEKLEERKKIVAKWAQKLGVIILQKGLVDIISDGETTKLNDVHNEAMTVGGTGDVLAGIIGCLLSKKVEPLNAARMAAFINGAAGNLAFKKRSYGLIATDVIDEISTVLKEYLE